VLRPEADLAERLARIRLVLMDVDGTLVHAGKESFSNVIVQLRKIKLLGIGFSLATGRTIGGISLITDQLRRVGARLPPMITYNGAVVFSGQDSFLFVRRLIDRDLIGALVRWCRAKSISPLVYACHLEFAFHPRRGIEFPLAEAVYAEGAPRPEREFNGMEIEVVEDLLSIDDEFVAVLIEVPDGTDASALACEASSAFGGALRTTTSGGRYVEISHPFGTKRHAMTELARMLNLSIDHIMAIGDNFNDLDMIAAAGVGAAVANAPKPVRDAARLQLTRAGAEGVVEALRVLTRSVRIGRALAAQRL
jgi:Cof subfamily protein (haloacid dehalogenase superfamily)